MINHQNISTHKTSEIIIWLLAISPIVGVIIQTYLALILSMSFNRLWIVTIFLTIFLAIYDTELLKKEGEYRSRLGNPMLVPIYLVKRAKVFHHTMAYVFIWYASVILVLVIPQWKITELLVLG